LAAGGSLHVEPVDHQVGAFCLGEVEGVPSDRQTADRVDGLLDVAAGGLGVDGALGGAVELHGDGALVAVPPREALDRTFAARSAEPTAALPPSALRITHRYAP
jgi:hypothetical protein